MAASSLLTLVVVCALTLWLAPAHPGQR